MIYCNGELNVVEHNENVITCNLKSLEVFEVILLKGFTFVVEYQGVGGWGKGHRNCWLVDTDILWLMIKVKHVEILLSILSW